MSELMNRPPINPRPGNAQPIKFHAADGHRVSGGRADAYGSVDVHIDGSWEAFAHTSATPGLHLEGAGQRGTVMFFDGGDNVIFHKELYNFNINPGGERADNIGAGANDIPSDVVAAVSKMGFTITDGESHPFPFDAISETLQALLQVCQIVMSIVGDGRTQKYPKSPERTY
jgi:hypothetical protein